MRPQQSKNDTWRSFTMKHGRQTGRTGHYARMDRTLHATKKHESWRNREQSTHRKRCKEKGSSVESQPPEKLESHMFCSEGLQTPTRQDWKFLTHDGKKWLFSSRLSPSPRRSYLHKRTIDRVVFSRYSGRIVNVTKMCSIIARRVWCACYRGSTGT